MERLRFKTENAKLSNTLIFNLPAGYFCPGAKTCLSRSDRITGCITDGPETLVRCFGASCEARSKNLRNMVWRNADLIVKALRKGTMACADLIDDSMVDWNGLVRIHSTGGDFFRRSYLAAWMEVAKRRPGKVVEFNGKLQPVGTVFYTYSKQIPFFVGTELPDNFHVAASLGGQYDDRIPESGLHTARIVLRESEAVALGLEMDHDDSHVWKEHKNFAMIVHGTQPTGSEAARAKNENRKAGGFTGYSRKDKVTV